MSKKVQAIITGKILESLEKGTIPWDRPWNIDFQRNLNSKRKYRGINLLLLEMYQQAYGYDTNFWCTFEGAKKAGGNVKKDEKSNIVIWASKVEKKDKDDVVVDSFFTQRYYKVFNASQCEGIEVPELETIEFEPIERAEEIVEGYDGPSYKEGGSRAFYSPKKDHVQLPKKEFFKSNDSYYTTRFHELVHSTGHESRLHRKEVMEIETWGDIRYAKEELVAEIGACMLASHCDLDPSNIERGSDYIASWLKKLDDDPNMVIRAAAESQKAYDLILGEEKEESNES